eukprot:TRINITY_DN827_c0_g1_i1.p1 TRINITY_DN827_c0_g1~~TRINITY_DN827_c0_g1_i1.p1  ORF type:complete len:130 (+),score=10.24 TRINITY_DN827_c0_g1_i1:395-784(+)
MKSILLILVIFVAMASSTIRFCAYTDSTTVLCTGGTDCLRFTEGVCKQVESNPATSVILTITNSTNIRYQQYSGSTCQGSTTIDTNVLRNTCINPGVLVIYSVRITGASAALGASWILILSFLLLSILN